MRQTLLKGKVVGKIKEKMKKINKEFSGCSKVWILKTLTKKIYEGDWVNDS